MEPPSRKRGRPLKHSKIASSDTSKSRVAQDSSESNSVSPSTVAHVDLADRAVSPVDPRLSQRGRKKPVADKYGKDYDYDAPVKLLDKLLHSMSQTEDEQLVVVSQEGLVSDSFTTLCGEVQRVGDKILVADINIGYEDIVITQVVVFNGTSVRNLKHLANLVEKCTDPFLRFDLDYQQIVVLET